MRIESPAAIVVVEMQNDLVSPGLVEQKGLSGSLARAVQRRGVIERFAALLAVCRARGVAVLYATKERHPGIPLPDHPRIYRAAGADPKLVHGTWGAQVVDELKPEPVDVVLPRFVALDPSYGSELWAVLERLGARTLIVAGVSTTVAVEGTVRAAANRGYRVVVVEDCCAGVPDEWHAFAVERILPLLSDVVAARTLIEALSPPSLAPG